MMYQVISKCNGVIYGSDRNRDKFETYEEALQVFINRLSMIKVPLIYALKFNLRTMATKIKENCQLVGSLALRKLFREHETICIAANNHCSTWFVIDKGRFFSWTERRNDIYQYHYIVEIGVTDIDTCVRIHSVRRTRKP